MITEVLSEEGRMQGSDSCIEVDYFFRGDMPSGRAYGYLQAQCARNVAYLHIHVMDFNRAILREMRDDMREIKKMLASRGISIIIGVKTASLSRQLVRLVELVGGFEVQEHDIDGVRRIIIRSEVRIGRSYNSGADGCGHRRAGVSGEEEPGRG